jgi:hypothetical protein
MKRFLIPISLLALASCIGTAKTTRVSQRDSDRILGLCGGGYSSSSKVALTAVLDKANLNGNISGGLEEEFKAIILRTDGVTESNLPIIYSAFLSCIKDQTGL